MPVRCNGLHLCLPSRWSGFDSRYRFMSTTKQQLTAWFNAGVSHEATHMIVVCDTFDHSDYPVYVTADQNPRVEAAKRDGRNMQQVMEVYDLRLDCEPQMAEHRAFHF